MQIDERMVDWKPVGDSSEIDERMVKWKSPADASIEKMSRDRRGSSLAALNGLTFGFADEIAGAIGGQGVRDRMRSELEAYKAENPGRGFVNEVIGGIPFGMGLGKVVPQLNTLGRQMLAGGGIAGVTGTITGAGESKADTPAGVAKDALQSGALSLAMGAGLPVGVAGASVVGQQVGSRVFPSLAQRFGAEKVAEAFARDGLTGTQAATRMQALGPEARAVDAGRENVRQTLDTLATAPGQTKSLVESAIAQRQQTRGGRMREAAEDAFGVNGVRLAEEMPVWMQQRTKQSTPLYEKLHRVDIPVNQNIAQVVDIAQRNGLTGLAARIADFDKVPFTLTNGLDPQVGRFAMRDLDYIKRAMDTKLSSLVDKQTGNLTSEGVALKGLRDDFVSDLDRMTMGQYKKARDAWAGPSAVMDAANAGKRALLQDDASIKSMMTGMSGSEKDAFALGAFEALRAKLGTQAGQTEMMKLWRQDGMKEKLQAIFGDQKAYLDFARKMYGEKTMAKLETVGRGSQTAARMQSAADLAEPVASMASGSPLGILAGTRNLLGRLGTPEPVRDAMGAFMLSRDPSKVGELAPLIEEITRGRTNSTIGFGLGAGLL